MRGHLEVIGCGLVLEYAPGQIKSRAVAGAQETTLPVIGQGRLGTGLELVGRRAAQVRADAHGHEHFGLDGAVLVLGLSVGNVVTQDMVKSMARNPIGFAMANPDPEITYEDAVAVRKDIIMATGRSDYPNQVNNVLGFPYIFRGALDVRATQINEAMKLAAARALAELTKTPVPDIVNLAYNQNNMSFGPLYIIPKPLDPRLLSTIAPAVAKAVIESGVAQKHITNWDGYVLELNERLGLENLS